MRRFIIIFVSVLFVLVSTCVFAATPANTLPQFTTGGHVLGFTPNTVFIAGMGHALTEEFINPNRVTPNHLSSHTVIYENLWKGISLTYEARRTGIAESTYTVSPGADVKNIQVRYNAEVTIQNNGTLAFNHPTSKGTYTVNAPVAWQEKEGTKIPVQVAYTKLSDTAIGFTTGSYDRTLPLVIDPVYQWHTFHGSSDSDCGYSIAVDTSGNVYVTGRSDTTWGSPLNPHSGSDDIVVVKLNSSGAYQWHTFYGSNDDDIGYGIAVDTSGNVYVTGYSNATWGSPLNTHSGNWDMVVVKLNSSGAYQWHTFHGSDSYDWSYGIAVDTSGNVYVTGYSRATWGSPINPHSGDWDMVVVKLDSSGVYQWHTFHGSSDSDCGYGIAVDTSGNVYVTGYSSATWGSPLNPHSGNWDIVVLKLDSSGAYHWHTFYGSSNADGGYGIAVDTSGNVYVTGHSTATWGTPLAPYNGGYDIVVLKLDSSGAYQWHTFYGSGGGDYGYGIALDTNGNVYVTGGSNANWGSPINSHSGGDDIVVLKLDSSGVYQWHTFYGSSNYDWGFGIAVDAGGNVYVTGVSDATWGLPLNSHSGNNDIVVLKLARAVVPTEGTIGTRITTNGLGFGDKKGKVLINGIAAKIAKGDWGDTQITCTINKPPLPVDVAHPVLVVVDKVPRVLGDTFTLRLPALDELSIASGAYPDSPIRVTGRFFGTKKGKAYLYNPATEKKKKLKVIDWRMNESTGVSELTFVVPKTSKSFPAGTYQLEISNKIGPAPTSPDFNVLEPGP
jgi:hypothetical protein